MARSRPQILLLALPILLACGDGGGTAPDPTPPEITVEGVEEGASYAGPVTIDIRVDRGTYQATLDGEPFLSGATVSAPGEHVLAVSARDGVVTSEVEIRFSIVLSGSSALIVRMLDLGANASGGGGDAILLTDSSATARHVLVDAGPAGTGGSDAGFVARRLAALGVDTLSALVLSHAHSDHFDGMPAVLRGVHVERFIYNGQQRTFGAYNALISDANSLADTVIVLASPLDLSLSGTAAGATVMLIPPLPAYLSDPSAGGAELNEGSIGGVVRKGTFDLFLTGDGEVEANRRWRTQYASLSASVEALKVGHHGANDAIFDNGFSGTSSWLTHTDPEVALISANGTSHPRINALTRLLTRSNTRTYCTNVHGDIEVRVGEGGSYLVGVERNADMDCVAGSDATS